jgi:hypothetical protein
MRITLSDAIKVVCNELMKNEVYRNTWLANLTMAIHDTQCVKCFPCAGQGAHRFLGYLCSEPMGVNPHAKSGRKA